MRYVLYKIPDEIDMMWITDVSKRRKGPAKLHIFNRSISSPIFWAQHDDPTQLTNPYNFSFGIRFMRSHTFELHIRCGFSTPWDSTFSENCVVDLSYKSIAQLALQKSIDLISTAPAGIVLDYIQEHMGQSEDAPICKLLHWMQEVKYMDDKHQPAS